MKGDAEELFRTGVQPRHGWFVRTARRALWPLVRAWFLHEHDRTASLQRRVDDLADHDGTASLQRQVDDLANQLASVRARADEAAEGAGGAWIALERLRSDGASQVAAIGAAAQSEQLRVSAVAAASDDVATRLSRFEEAVQAEWAALGASREALSRHIVDDRIAPLEELVRSVAHDAAALRSAITDLSSHVASLDADTKARLSERVEAESRVKTEMVALSNIVSHFRDLIEGVVSGRDVEG